MISFLLKEKSEGWTWSYSRFEVHQDGAWDVARIVGLVEEDILAITSFSRKVLEVSVAVDSMFLTQLLPEL